ncbi:hypothetical protein [Metapseudomonas otitidis]|uniref:hypothetical protein n=1 Tax=Metapseudomonas otitidis TaxID=319939 RepID=UPI0013F67A82|nr:hypothetical protein [Pseudomonas otitidis]
MQCPKCNYEPTLSEVQRSPNDCVSCGINYEGHARHMAELAEKKKAEAQLSASIAKAPPAIRNAITKYPGAQPVVVVDINMSFWSMVMFMVKWVFATIPAAIIIVVIVYGGISIFGLVGNALDTSHYQTGSTQPTTSSGGYTVDPPKPSVPAQVVSAALIGKGFDEGEFGNDKITISILFKNDGSKDIRAFDGVFEFTDLLGNVILRSNVRVNEALSAGQSLSWDGSIDYNEFIASNRNLRNETQENVRLNFKLGKVLYSDGSKEEY